ncbi:MAG TPA: lipoyl(octanoyl) transferase LipB [Candidatus Binataceae bacterium]|nr:lipoyl(octanoyl) transferase LipB [Candidatus Binataceae bacterium]
MTQITRILSVANLGTVEYQAALALQTAMVAARQSDAISDTLLILEHPHVFTLGRGADERFLLAQRPGEVPIYRISRGGEVTYHGPGQLVGYPIIKLEGRDRDVHRYLRNLEEAMLRALADFDIQGMRREGLTGIWVGAKKIGSIGVGIKRWTTCHGFALNVCPDLSYFRGIVPCGIDGCEMTSIEAHRDRISIDEFATAMRSRFAEVFDYAENGTVDPATLWQLVESNVAEERRDA